MLVNVRPPIVQFTALELQLKNQIVPILQFKLTLNDLEVLLIDHEYLQTFVIEVILDDGLVRRENGTQLGDRHSPLGSQPDEIGILKLRLSHQLGQGLLANVDL